MTSAAVIASERTTTSPDTGNRLSAVPKDEWAIERNPVCTGIRIAMQAQKAAATDIAEIERASHTC